MDRAIMAAAIEMPTLNPVVCVTGMAGLDVAAAAVLEVWDVGVEEVWLDEGLVVRAVDDLDVSDEVFEFGELVVELEDFELEVVREAGDDAVELGDAVTPMIVCASPSGIKNVPSPFSQSQVPESTAD